MVQLLVREQLSVEGMRWGAKFPSDSAEEGVNYRLRDLFEASLSEWPKRGVLPNTFITRTISAIPSRHQGIGSAPPQFGTNP